MSYSKAQPERDCTEKCRSIQHGNEICEAITKREVTDSQLCAFLNWKCWNCGFIGDSNGKNALHFAASCGRRKLVQWLIKSKGAQINAKDLESGYTALHRSVFYGKLNVTIGLTQLGANLNIVDNNDLTAIEHALKDRMNRIEYNGATPCQVYVWGTNTNYTLGTGSQQSRQLPELLDAFHKKYAKVSVKQVCLDKFHFVLVGTDGRVFSCGHGQGGRLGLISENTVLEPQEIKFQSTYPYPYSYSNLPTFVCTEASIARDHSLFLSESGHVWSCGLNTHHVLGIKPPPPQIVVPRPLAEFKQQIIGVCASRFHSVVWGPNAIFTWGLHAGQLGHDRTPNQTYVTPKLVTNFYGTTEIISVATSDGATVVSTKRGDVYVLHEYQCRKIASRQLNIVKTVVIGGHLNSKVSSDVLVEKGGNELKVLVLTSVGNLLFWQESYPQLTRCIYNLNRSLIIKDVVLNRSELLLVTDDGEAFRGEFRAKKKKTQEKEEKKNTFHEFLEKDDCQVVKVTRLPNIHRGVKIQSDLKGRNYAVLQVDPCYSLVTIPQVSQSNLKDDMLNLLINSDEMDTLHDALFKVTDVIFPVHRYIIALKSEHLNQLVETTLPNKTIEINCVHPKIFQQVLVYIYTGTCDLLNCGECLPNLRNLNVKTKSNVQEKIVDVHENMSAYAYYSSNKQEKGNEIELLTHADPIRLLQEASKRFGLKMLCKKLDALMYVDGFIIKKDGKQHVPVEKLNFDRSFKKMYDVVIKTKNGDEILAHKCILAARLEYFNNIFAVRWNMNSTRNTISLPISYTILEKIIEFLYTDESKSLENCVDIDFICSLLIVSDQLFIDRLKQLCEIALSQLLTLRNATQMLNLSCIYNAAQLKRCVMEFMSLNLPTFLESRSLEILDEDILDDLTNYYCEWNINMSKRVITPFSNAPLDEIVKSISDTNPIILKSDDSDQENDIKINKYNKRKTRVRTSESNKYKSKDTVESKIDDIIEDTCVINEVLNKEPKQETWTKILTEKQKHQKLVQARLKAAAIIKEETPKPDTYTRLSKTSNKNIPQQNSNNSTPTSSPVFTFSPLQSPNNSFIDSPKLKSPIVYDIPIQKMVRISQKQRKKYALETSNLVEQLDNVNKLSFTESMKPTASPITSPKNPWKKLEVPVQELIEEMKPNFADIVADEKKQREIWTKMRTKPLIYTQMEDKAIDELLKFYNAEGSTDEFITIHRVDKGAYSAPLWVAAKSTK